MAMSPRWGMADIFLLAFHHARAHVVHVSAHDAALRGESGCLGFGFGFELGFGRHFDFDFGWHVATMRPGGKDILPRRWRVRAETEC